MTLSHAYYCPCCGNPGKNLDFYYTNELSKESALSHMIAPIFNAKRFRKDMIDIRVNTMMLLGIFVCLFITGWLENHALKNSLFDKGLMLYLVTYFVWLLGGGAFIIMTSPSEKAIQDAEYKYPSYYNDSLFCDTCYAIFDQSGTHYQSIKEREDFLKYIQYPKE